MNPLNDVEVYIANSGTSHAYHRTQNHAGYKSMKVTVRNAWNRGLSPCLVCRPPEPFLDPPKPLPPSQEQVDNRAIGAITKICLEYQDGCSTAGWRSRIKEILDEHHNGSLNAFARHVEEILGVAGRRRELAP